MGDREEGQWETTSVDPDMAEDLGYEHDPLTAIHVDEDGEQYIFLPGEEEHLTDEEFMIASPDAISDLSEWR